MIATFSLIRQSFSFLLPSSKPRSNSFSSNTKFPSNLSLAQATFTHSDNSSNQNKFPAIHGGGCLDGAQRGSEYIVGSTVYAAPLMRVQIWQVSGVQAWRVWGYAQWDTCGSGVIECPTSPIKLCASLSYRIQNQTLLSYWIGSFRAFFVCPKMLKGSIWKARKNVENSLKLI